MKLITLFTCLLLATKLAGQVFHSGISAGVNISEIFLAYTYTDMHPGKNKTGFELGGFTNYRISKKLINQIELCYVEKGHKILSAPLIPQILALCRNG